MKLSGNLYLIGFSGSGKSTVASKVAETAGLPLFDTDNYVELKEGKAITDIFSQNGETYFRTVETKILKQAAQLINAVVATGGGVPVSRKNTELMKRTGMIIWLQTTPEIVVQRLSRAENEERPPNVMNPNSPGITFMEASKQTRPLIKNPASLKDIEDFMKKRQQYYVSAADAIVHSEGKRLSDTVAEVLKLWKNYTLGGQVIT